MSMQRRAGHSEVLFLASVTDAAEARIAAAGGADIVDCKDPASGALGALPYASVQAIRAALPATTRLSATIGDLPCEPEVVAAAVEAMARTGVDYVKVGLFPGGDELATIRRLGDLDIGRCRLVGLLLADRAPDFGLLAAMGRAGFAGVMLDTADKSAGPLVRLMPQAEIVRFIAAAHSTGLFAGLAGALRLEHVAELTALGPDVLGFRGALCRGASRTGSLDPRAVAGIRLALSAGALGSHTDVEEAFGA